MTRKDFYLLARALHDCKPDDTWSAEVDQWKKDVKAIREACAVTNGLFDHGRFDRVCCEG